MNNKYIEYFNDQIVYTEPKELNKDAFFNSFCRKISKENEPFGKNKMSNDYSLKLFNNEYRWLSLYLIKPSGDLKNTKKRIQIQKNKKNENNSIAIGIYFAGNKNCYVKFEGDNVLNNKNSSSTSIWIEFSLILICLKFNVNISYTSKNNTKCEKYYLTTNPKNFFNNTKFIELSDDFIDKISDYIKEENNKLLDKNYTKNVDNINENYNKIDYSISSIFSDNKNDKTYTNTLDKIQKYSEELLNKKLLDNDSLILEKLKINNIEKIIWANKIDEKNKPYDFLINDEIYINVYPKEENVFYFKLNAYEREFAENVIEKGYKYFVISICNLKEKNEEIYKFIPFERVDKYFI